jgi:hypothetical protein
MKKVGMSRDPIYRRRRFSAETIELCVRWYITYRLSYRPSRHCSAMTAAWNLRRHFSVQPYIGSMWPLPRAYHSTFLLKQWGSGPG